MKNQIDDNIDIKEDQVFYFLLYHLDVNGHAIVEGLFGLADEIIAPIYCGKQEIANDYDYPLSESASAFDKYVLYEIDAQKEQKINGIDANRLALYIDSLVSQQEFPGTTEVVTLKELIQNSI